MEKKTKRKRDGIPRRAILRYQDCAELKLERTGCHIESKGRITPKTNKNKETKKLLDKTERMIFSNRFYVNIHPQSSDVLGRCGLMEKIEKFHIVFNNPSATYLAGETVYGYGWLVIKEPVYVSSKSTLPSSSHSLISLVMKSMCPFVCPLLQNIPWPCTKDKTTFNHSELSPRRPVTTGALKCCASPIGQPPCLYLWFPVKLTKPKVFSQ
ncbi:hypothetical protein RRG08_036226 [Elysia crispata]|uniref:Uncharacterized protein n=1 Tax=Elysia crispata TaxID=231223 RepID=A0AAE0XEW9_9GAST|nr:hypothetical protein RRG08_036226 [Elysia crispata]